MGFDLARDRHHSLRTGRRAYRVGLAPPPFPATPGRHRFKEETPRATIPLPLLGLVLIPLSGEVKELEAKLL